jgi:hypothetical protein
MKALLVDLRTAETDEETPLLEAVLVQVLPSEHAISPGRASHSASGIG